MKYIKQFEEYIRLNDTPTLKDRTGHEKSELLYNKDDLVIFKSLNRLFKIHLINRTSPNQDYYLQNSFDKAECGWVLQHEIRKATNKEIEQSKIEQTTNKYNL